ncbi:MAG TPA: glutathione peroxidase [Chitinophagaceae bacterium]|nr:glutathione peroxidase [Chitinophagaceae bacterium]
MNKPRKYRWLKKAGIILFMFLLVFSGYVELANLNSKHMTYRQKVLKAVYPAWMWWSRITGTNKTELSNNTVQPPVSFYSLSGVLNNGNELDFSTLKGKKVLLVNTASDCGYTDQYDDLQKLYEKYNNSLVIIGFPANDFKEQEKGTDEEIAQFCKLNYGVTFPLMKKSVVIKNDQQNEVFKWLTDSSKNGWNSKQPSWNFCKYLVNENGMLTNYFGSSISPLSKDVTKAIQGNRSTN